MKDPDPPRDRSRTPFRILFVCTGNSARSQLAEGLANHLGGGDVEAHSAGTLPAGVNNHSVAVMQERGIDISRHRSKRIDEVPGPFDLVITLCDSAALLCPASVRDYPMAHWSTPDPSFVPGGPEAVHQAFRGVRDQLEIRITTLLDEIRRGGRGEDGTHSRAGGRKNPGVTKRAVRR
jgi:protein-tyrosine-phosphatase